MRFRILLVFSAVLVCSMQASAQLKFGCTDPSEACATQDPDTLQLRKDRIRELYTGLVYPTPLAVIDGSLKVDHIFEQTYVRGRVTPVGTFPGFEAAIEYFYGLAGAPGRRVENVSFDALIAGDDKVGVKVNLFFCTLPDGGCDQTTPVGPSSFTLTQTGFYRFNSDNKIVSFDLTILNLGSILDPKNDADKLKNIQQTCLLLTLGISAQTGPTCPMTFDDKSDYPSNFLFNPTLPQPLRSFENCMGYMREIPYGTWDRAHSNSFVCRQLHSLLTPIRPEYHCPHTSPSGGEMCVDHPYSFFYEEEF